jgi:hypothetical protein
MIPVFMNSVYSERQSYEHLAAFGVEFTSISEPVLAFYRGLSRKYSVIMSDPRPWPNNAKEVRDLAAEEAVYGRKALEPFLTIREPNYTAEEWARRLAFAVVSFQKISRLLESVGAQTNPLYDQYYDKFESKKE